MLLAGQVPLFLGLEHFGIVVMGSTSAAPEEVPPISRVIVPRVEPGNCGPLGKERAFENRTGKHFESERERLGEQG